MLAPTRAAGVGRLYHIREVAVTGVARHAAGSTGCRRFRRRPIVVDFSDVDLCLRARATGRQVLWTPHAR